MKKCLLCSGAILFAAVILTGCCSTSEPAVFQRVFSWGIPRSEDEARRYAEIGVTDIRVSNRKQYAWVVKYGMTPYCGTFSATGPRRQVVTPAEAEYMRYISGGDLDRRKYSKAEIRTIVQRRLLEKNHRYGGDVEPGTLDTLSNLLYCFNSDQGYRLSRKKLDHILARAVPGVKGIYFDYIGYSNYHGCYCAKCVQDYQKFLQENSLPDSAENRHIFYRDLLVNYYNAMIDYVKSKRPDFKVLVHIYPVFMPEPLYGNRTKADFCGQTVAWYFAWETEKIVRNTEFTVKRGGEYFSNAAGVPFVGLNSKKGSALAYKSPEQLEKELQLILAAGGRTLQVCSGRDMLAPGYYEVFKKYCRPRSSLRKQSK